MMKEKKFAEQAPRRCLSYNQRRPPGTHVGVLVIFARTRIRVERAIQFDGSTLRTFRGLATRANLGGRRDDATRPPASPSILILVLPPFFSSTPRRATEQKREERKDKRKRGANQARGCAVGYEFCRCPEALGLLYCVRGFFSRWVLVLTQKRFVSAARTLPSALGKKKNRSMINAKIGWMWG